MCDRASVCVCVILHAQKQSQHSQTASELWEQAAAAASALEPYAVRACALRRCTVLMRQSPELDNRRQPEATSWANCNRTRPSERLRDRNSGENFLHRPPVARLSYIDQSCCSVSASVCSICPTIPIEFECKPEPEPKPESEPEFEFELELQLELELELEPELEREREDKHKPTTTTRLQKSIRHNKRTKLEANSLTETETKSNSKFEPN